MGLLTSRGESANTPGKTAPQASLCSELVCFHTQCVLPWSGSRDLDLVLTSIPAARPASLLHPYHAVRSEMLSWVSLCPPVAINQIFPCKLSSCFLFLYPLILSSFYSEPP